VLRQLGKEIRPTRDEIKSGVCSRGLSPVVAKRGESTKPRCITSLLVPAGSIPGSQCNNYIISRAFIPPWSLVMTRPETLGPDTSVAEAGTLVSSDQLYRMFSCITAFSETPIRKHLIQVQLLLKLHFTPEIQKNNTGSCSPPAVITHA
jgi:hypothetical protein